MASETKIVSIDGSKILLTAGNYQLVWGALNPQELNNQQVAIQADVTAGDVTIALPPTSEPQSGFAKLIIGREIASANVLYVAAHDGDTINGKARNAELPNGGYAMLVNLFGNNWVAFLGGGK